MPERSFICTLLVFILVLKLDSGVGNSLTDIGALVLFRSANVTSGPHFVVPVNAYVIDILMMSSWFLFLYVLLATYSVQVVKLFGYVIFWIICCKITYTGTLCGWSACSILYSQRKRKKKERKEKAEVNSGSKAFCGW